MQRPESSRSPVKSSDIYEAIRTLQQDKIKLQAELENEKQRNKQILTRIERKLQELMQDYAEKDKKLKNSEQQVLKMSDDLAKVTSLKNDALAKLALAQQETQLTKQELMMKDKEIEKNRDETKRVQRELSQDLENLKRNEDNRINNLIRQVKQSSYSSRPDDPLIEENKQLSNENRALHQEMENQRDLFDKHLSQISLQKDEMTAELNKALRQIDNLNLVLETKEQEIAGWEERFITLQNGHNQQLENLQNHFENLIAQKLEKELKELQIAHERQRSDNDHNWRLQHMRHEDNEAKNKAIMRDKDQLIQQMQQRLAELDFLLPTLSSENTNLHNELEQAKNQLREQELQHQQELQEIKGMAEDTVRIAQESGYQQGQSAVDGQFQALQQEYAQLKERFVEACQRIIVNQEEVEKMNDIVDNYKGEIQNWKNRLQEQQVKAAEDVKRIRADYDAQTQEWLEREMYETNRKHVSERTKLEDQLKDKDRELNRSEHACRDLQFQNRALEQQVQSLQLLEQEVQERENEVNLLKSSNMDLRNQIDQLDHISRQEVQRLQLQNENVKKDLERQIRKLREEIDNLSNELHIVQGQKQEFEDEIRTMKFQNENLQHQFTFLQQSHNSQFTKQQGEIDRLHDEIDQLNQEKHNLEHQLKLKNQQHNELLNNMRNLQRQNEDTILRNQELEFDIETKHENHLRDLEKLQGQLHMLENQNRQLKQKVGETETHLHRAEQEAQSQQYQNQQTADYYEEQLHNLKAEKLQTEAQLKSLKFKLEQSERENKSLESEREDLQMDLQRVQEDLKNSMKQAGQDKAQMENNIRKLEQQLKHANQAIEELEIRIKTSDEQISKHRRINNELEEDVKKWQQQYQSMEFDFTQQNEQLVDDLERAQMNTKDLEVRFNAEKSALETKIMTLENHLQEADETIAQYERDLKRYEQQAQERQRELEKLRQQVSQAKLIESDFEDLSQRHEEMLNEFQNLQQEKIKFTATKNQLDKNIKRLEEEVKAKTDEYEEAYAQIKKHRDDADAVGKERDQLKKQLLKEQNSVNEKNNTIQLNEERIALLERDVQELQKQVDSQRSLNRKMEGELKLRQNELQDKIAELDQIKAKYEDNWNKMQNSQPPRPSIYRQNAPNPMEQSTTQRFSKP